MTYLDYEEACSKCGKPTRTTCDRCQKPLCYGCQYQTSNTLTFPADPRNEDYDIRPTWSKHEEVCLTCYTEITEHPPFKLWQGSSAETTLIALGSSQLEPGVSIPAGDHHSWYRSPSAGDMLHLQWGDKHIDLDTFRTVQLLDFLKANEEGIRQQAKTTSDILVPIERRDTDRARRADLGIVDHERYDDE